VGGVVAGGLVVAIAGVTVVATIRPRAAIMLVFIIKEMSWKT
jgi:hypothetical protein